MRYLRMFEEFDPIVQVMVRICEDSFQDPLRLIVAPLCFTTAVHGLDPFTCAP